MLNETSFICTAQHHDHIASVNDVLRTSRRDDWLTQHVEKRRDVRNLRTTVCWQRGSCAISSLIAEVILTKPALLHVCGSRVSQLDSLTFIKWSSELKHLQEEQESTNTNILLGKYIPTPWTHVERDNEQNSSLPADEQLTDIMWSAVSVNFSLFTSNTRVSVEPSLLHHESEPEPEQGGKPAARTQNTESGQCEGHCGGFEHSWGWLQAFNALKL